MKVPFDMKPCPPISSLLIGLFLTVVVSLVGCNNSDKNLIQEEKTVKFQRTLHHTEVRSLGKDLLSVDLKNLWPWLDKGFTVENINVRNLANGQTCALVDNGDSPTDKMEAVFHASSSVDSSEHTDDYQIEIEVYVLWHRVSWQASGPLSETVIDVPETDKIVPYRAAWESLSEKTPYVLKLKRHGSVDASSIQSILESIVTAGMTDEETAMAIWGFLVDSRYHAFPAQTDSETHDPVKLICVYGYGFCDDSAAAFVVLCKAAGLKARMVGLSGHVVAEAFYDNAWHLFDVDLETYYQNENGEILSGAYLEAHSEVVAANKEILSGVKPSYVAKLYASTENNHYGWMESRDFPAYLESAQRHRIDPVLYPGDTVTFDYLNGEKLHRRSYLDKPLPSVFGTGHLVHKMSLSSDLYRNPTDACASLSWPWVLLDVEATLSQEMGRASLISYYPEKKQWLAMPRGQKDKYESFSFRRFLNARRGATYELNFCLNEQKESSSSQRYPLRVDADFQFAPRSLPHVQAGSNQFTVELQPVKTENNAELLKAELTLEWLTPI